MPYDNAYNQMLADDIMKMNRKYLDHERATGQGLSGGFLGALAGMILPQIVGAVANKIVGNGRCECPEDVADCECGDAHQAGEGMSGGSGFASGTFMDTGFDRTIGAGMSAGVKKYKKRPSKMGCGSAGAGRSGAGSCGGAKKPRKMKGAGLISDLGIPLISNVAGMFGLGSAGAGRSGAGVAGAGVAGAGVSGGAISAADKKVLMAVKARIEKGGKPTKAQIDKMMKMRDSGKLSGGFLPALLGAVAMPIISKILGGGLSGGAELGLPVALAGEGVAGAGSSGGKKRGRKSKMGAGVSGGRSLVPVANMKASSMAGQGRSGAGSSGGAAKDRRAIVKQVMADKGLGMIAASKYVKEHGLY